MELSVFLRVGCRSNLILTVSHVLFLGGQEYIKIEMPEFIEIPHAQQQQHQQFAHRKQDQQHSDQQVEDEHHLVDDDGNQEDDQHQHEQQHSSYELDEPDSDLEMLYQPNESGTDIGSAHLFTRYSGLF